MPQVAIIYGWAEGPWESKQFREAIKQKGFEVTDDLTEADILFGHSSGCYLVPRDSTSKTIFLIGLPYWPDRSLFSSVTKKLISEIKYHRKDKSIYWWLNKLLHNTWYILSRPKASYFVLTRHKIDYLPDGSNNKVLLVRPSDDSFTHLEAAKELSKTKNYRFIEIQGAHDDCWVKPSQYIDLMIHKA